MAIRLVTDRIRDANCLPRLRDPCPRRKNQSRSAESVWIESVCIIASPDGRKWVCGIFLFWFLTSGILSGRFAHLLCRLEWWIESHHFIQTFYELSFLQASVTDSNLTFNLCWLIAFRWYWMKINHICNRVITIWGLAADGDISSWKVLHVLQKWPTTAWRKSYDGNCIVGSKFPLQIMTSRRQADAGVVNSYDVCIFEPRRGDIEFLHRKK